MILQELCTCYDLLEKEENSAIAPPGYSRIICSFVIVLSEDGVIRNIRDIREGKRGEFFLVPEQKGRSGKNPPPYFLCDKSKYLLGFEFDKSKKELVPSKIAFDASYELHRKILGHMENKEAKAVLKFFERVEKGELPDIEPENPVYQGGFIVFNLEGNLGNIHDSEEIKEAWKKYLNSLGDTEGMETGQCLITGEENTELARTHTLIKGVLGTNPTGGAIVGFNFRSVESYDKKQSYNSPVSQKAMFKYTTALNYLLSGDKNRIIVGDMTIFFWTSKGVSVKESMLVRDFMLGDIVEDESSRDVAVEDEIKKLLARAKNGNIITEEMLDLDTESQVYILGLSPNVARISVRFFHRDTMLGFIKKMIQYYIDSDIVKSQKIEEKSKYISIKDILRSTAVQGKAENIPKSLEASLFNSILNGTQLPSSVFNNILLRIRSEVSDQYCVNYVRAGFIKAYLIRYFRINKKGKEEEITVGLNIDSEDRAYNLGRLFAVLEKLQADANGSSGIRERFFASASATPMVVFPTLLNLAQHHIEKAQYGKSFDIEIGKIMNKINEFPSTHSLEEQGMFILGYYHQREYIYTKKEDK